jgi:hypothetical protein
MKRDAESRALQPPSRSERLGIILEEGLALPEEARGGARDWWNRRGSRGRLLKTAL